MVKRKLWDKTIYSFILHGCMIVTGEFDSYEVGLGCFQWNPRSLMKKMLSVSHCWMQWDERRFVNLKKLWFFFFFLVFWVATFYFINFIFIILFFGIGNQIMSDHIWLYIFDGRQEAKRTAANHAGSLCSHKARNIYKKKGQKCMGWTRVEILFFSVQKKKKHLAWNKSTCHMHKFPSDKTLYQKI